MDEEGNPKNAELIQKFADQQDYINLLEKKNVEMKATVIIYRKLWEIHKGSNL